MSVFDWRGQPSIFGKKLALDKASGIRKVKGPNITYSKKPARSGPMGLLAANGRRNSTGSINTEPVRIIRTSKAAI